MTSPLDDFLAVYGRPPAPPPAITDPAFTVVVRTQGRRPKSLNEALDSLETQIHDAFDVVIVVHGAPADVERVRDCTGNRLHGRLRIESVDGGGRSAPLNAALLHVSGDYVCFLDDDDLVHDDWLSSFAEAIVESPGSIIRAVTQSQAWETDGGAEPVRPAGEIEVPFPERFDLLAHMSLNLTPICSLAYPARVFDDYGLRFCDDLPVYEDWDLLVRAAMVVGVVSIPDRTSLYRRLDGGNADTEETVATWKRAHAMVIDRLSAHPVLLPVGDARRLAGTHFVLDGRSRHETDLAAAEARIDELIRSPARWLQAFAARLGGAVRNRIAARRP